MPTRWVTGLLHDAIWPARAIDDGAPEKPREAAEIYRENDELRVRVLNLQSQLDHLKSLAAERAALGEISDRCTRYSVTGGDSGPRDSILLTGLSAGSLQPGMAALTRDCLVGRVERSGVGGAQVKLLTDKASRFTASFGRYETNPAGTLEFRRLDLPATFIQGLGNGEMQSSLLELKAVEAAGVREHDWLILDDTAWPEALRGYRIGRVESVKQSRQNILIAEITIRPAVDAMQLREVMVMDK
jgi:cell shape-determining protein MreC